MNLEFLVPGEPKPQARPRARVIQKAGRRPIATVYNAKGPDADYRARVAHEAQIAMQGEAPFQGPLDIDLRFLISKPKTKPKYKRFPDVKPDIDNFVKACFDTMAKIVFRDDAQVCRLSVQKEYSQTVGTEVRVVPLREKP